MEIVFDTHEYMPKSDKVLSDLIQVANDAKLHYQVWWALEHDGLMNFAPTLRRFPDYFEATRVANFRSMIMAAWKPFDFNSKVSSFKTLLDTHPAFLSETNIRMINDHLEKSRGITGLNKIRHQFIAHQNAKQNTEEIFMQADVTPNNLKELIYRTGDIINIIMRKRGWDNGVFESERGYESTIRLLTELSQPTD